jgi:hypothetical protein
MNKLEDVKNVQDLAEPVMDLKKTIVSIVTMLMNIFTMILVIDHVQMVPITPLLQAIPVKTVTPDVLFVKTKLIPDVLNVTIHGFFSKTHVWLVQNVAPWKECTVTTILMNVLHVLTNVSTVLILLITVPLVSHQELKHHLVTALMVTSIMVTLVLVVLITVLLVITEMNVSLVMISESITQLVTVQPDSSIMVKPNVKPVNSDAKNVMLTTDVLFVITLHKDLDHLVNVLKVGKTEKKDLLIVLKKIMKLD